MTVQIDSTAENNGLRLVQQTSHPASPTSGHEVLYVVSGSANGGLYLKDSSGRQIGPFITGSSGGGVTLDQADGAGIYHRLDAASADDDEFIGNSIDASWTQFVAGVGTGTWSQGNHALHCLYSGQAAAKLAVIGKAATLADGEAFETLLRFAIGTSVQYPFMGLFVSDGLIATSNCFVVSVYHDGGTPREWISVGTLQAIGAPPWTETSLAEWATGIRLKLYRTNSTNFGMKISTTNGYTFLPRPTAATTYNPGFTPTHAGLFVSTYGSSETFLTSFDFFRKVSA